MLSWLISPIMKWILGATLIAGLVTGVIVWHGNNFVSSDKYKQWRDHAINLEEAIRDRDAQVKEYTAELDRDQKTIDELEAENEKLASEKGSTGDGVVFDSADTERLRDFQARSKDTE